MSLSRHLVSSVSIAFSAIGSTVFIRSSFHWYSELWAASFNPWRSLPTSKKPLMWKGKWLLRGSGRKQKRLPLSLRLAGQHKSKESGTASSANGRRPGLISYVSDLENAVDSRKCVSNFLEDSITLIVKKEHSEVSQPFFKSWSLDLPGSFKVFITLNINFISDGLLAASCNS